MVDPISASVAIGMAGTVAGGIVGGMGSAQQGAAQAAASQYKAGVAQLNQQINLQNANFAIESGDIQVEETKLAGEQEIANTTVTQAASGFVVGQGTNKAVTDSQELVSEYDQNVIKWNASTTAWGYEAKAATDSSEATLDLMAAASERKAGVLGELSSFINAGTSVASKWYQGTSSGAINPNALGNFGPGSPFMGGGSPTGL